VGPNRWSAAGIEPLAVIAPRWHRGGRLPGASPAEELIQGDPFIPNGVVTKWLIRDRNEVLA